MSDSKTTDMVGGEVTEEKRSIRRSHSFSVDLKRSSWIISLTKRSVLHTRRCVDRTSNYCLPLRVDAFVANISWWTVVANIQLFNLEGRLIDPVSRVTTSNPPCLGPHELSEVSISATLETRHHFLWCERNLVIKGLNRFRPVSFWIQPRCPSLVQVLSDGKIVHFSTVVAVMVKITLICMWLWHHREFFVPLKFHHVRCWRHSPRRLLSSWGYFVP